MSPLSCSSASPHSSAAVGGGKGFESTEQKKKEGEKESREEASEHGGKKEKRATAQQKKGGEWNLGPASTVLHRGSTCNHAAAREHVVLRSMVSRKRGEKKRQKSMQRGARGFISTAAVAVESFFFFFFFFFSHRRRCSERSESISPLLRRCCCFVLPRGWYTYRHDLRLAVGDGVAHDCAALKSFEKI